MGLGEDAWDDLFGAGVFVAGFGATLGAWTERDGSLTFGTGISGGGSETLIKVTRSGESPDETTSLWASYPSATTVNSQEES